MTRLPVSPEHLEEIIAFGVTALEDHFSLANARRTLTEIYNERTHELTFAQQREILNYAVWIIRELDYPHLRIIRLMVLAGRAVELNNYSIRKIVLAAPNVLLDSVMRNSQINLTALRAALIKISDDETTRIFELSRYLGGIVVENDHELRRLIAKAVVDRLPTMRWYSL